MARRFRVTANFPVLESNAHQTVIVEGSSWMVALGKAAREFKRLPIMRRRRVTALSMMVEQMEGQMVTEAEVNAQPVAEQTVMEQADSLEQVDPLLEPTNEDYAAAAAEEAASQAGQSEAEALNQAANEEAERLIAEGQDVEE